MTQPPENQQLAIDALVGQIKIALMEMLNETTEHFEQMELTDEQRFVYNEFSSVFGEKVLNAQFTVSETPK